MPVAPSPFPTDWIVAVAVAFLTGGGAVKLISVFGHWLEARDRNIAQAEKSEGLTKARIIVNDREQLAQFIESMQVQIRQLQASVTTLQQENSELKIERERQRAAWDLERFRLHQEIQGLQLRLEKYETKVAGQEATNVTKQ